MVELPTFSDGVSSVNESCEGGHDEGGEDLALCRGHNPDAGVSTHEDCSHWEEGMAGQLDGVHPMSVDTCNADLINICVMLR